jgi:hypothetical protein
MRDAVRVAIDRDVPGEWIRLCGEKSLEHDERDYNESESFEHRDHH